MKKTILLTALVIGFNLAANAQINDDGFKKLSMGMTADEFKKLGDYTINEDGVSIIKYEGLDLELEFGEYDYLKEGTRENGPFLQSIETSSKEAKLYGVSENLIGKHYNEVKKILGSQLKNMWEGLVDDDEFPADHAFYAKNKKKNNYYFSLLRINEQGIIESIAVFPQP